jgi:hypothetical protein
MALQVKNSRDLIDPKNFKVKMLVYGLPGLGKTMFLSTAQQVGSLGIAACETGHGKGLLTIADAGIDYVEPVSYADFEGLCSGKVFSDKLVLCLDSLSSMTKTFIKDYALSIPRSGRGDSPKRMQGIPELDDYGTMGELTRRLTAKLLERDQHIIVTATERIDKPDPTDGPEASFMIGPDLPGQMFLGSTAMFDFVLRLRGRPKLANEKDPKSRYTERYFITQPDGMGTIAKCRSNHLGVPLLDREEVFNLKTGQGTFPYLLKKIVDGYALGLEAVQGEPTKAA